MKKILISLILFLLFIYNLNIIKADTITYIEIDKIEVIEEKNILKITATLTNNTNVKEFGILLGKGYVTNLTLNSDNVFKIPVNSLKNNNTFTVSIIMPKRAFLDTITIKGYVISTNGNEVYTNNNVTSYNQSLTKEVIKVPQVTKISNGLRFETKSNVFDACEYGVMINRGIIDNANFTIDYCLNNPNTTMVISSPNLTDINSFILNLDNFPARAYYQKLTIKSYVKYLDEYNNSIYLYSNDSLYTSYYELINEEIISNIKTSYSEKYDGLRFEITTNANLNIENDIIEIGIILLNQDVDILHINTKNVYIEKITNLYQNTYAVIIQDFPKDKYEEIISATGYIKYQTLDGKEEIFYSKNITKTTFNQELLKLS